MPNETEVTEGVEVVEEINNLYCSCVLWVNHLNPKAPLIDAKWYANFKLSKAPILGSIAVFKYNNGVYHVGKVIKLKAESFDISEANFKKCQQTTRDIKYDDYALLGFFIP